jgi:putative ABC transport system permease protein
MALAVLAVVDASVLGPMRHAPGRTLLAVFAIALGVALGFAIYLLNRVAADEVSLAARSLFGVADLAIEASGEGFDENLYPIIARLAGVAVASPVVEVQAKLIGRRGALTLLGMDPYRSRRLQPSFATLGATMSRDGSDSEPSGLQPVFLSASAARSLDLVAGDVLEVQIGLQRERFEVAAILPSTALRERAGVMDIATVQWKFGRLGKLSRLNLRLMAGASAQQIRQALAGILPANARVITPGDATDDALRLSRAYRSNLTALALVALFTGGFFVYSTQSLAVLRRRREFALLHALGVTRTEQLVLTLLSGAVVGFAGALLGLALGIAIAKVGMNLLGGDLGAGLFPGITPELRLRFWEVAAFCVLGAGVAIVGTLRPALDAARIPTASALKAGDIASGQVRTHGAVVAALFTIAAVVLLLPSFAGLPLPGYVSIGLLIIATVAAMPAVLLAMLNKAPRRQSVPYEIAIAHLRGTARYATLSVSAIVVSFSLMIAMAIMVTSFRHSLDLWTQKILPADLYIRAGYMQQSSHFDAAAVAALRTIPGIANLQVSRFAQADLPIAASPGAHDTVILIARDLDPARIDQVLWMEKRADTPVPAGAIPIWISEAAADLFALRAGAAVDVLVAGKKVTASVRGVWRDYEHQGGAIIMDREAYVQLTGDAFINAVWMWLEPGASQEAVQQAIRDRLPPDAEYDMRTPHDIRNLSLQAFDRTFAVTYALEFIAILIGLFGISAGTSAQVLARRSEFGVLRHIGLTRTQIATTLAIEGIGLGALGVFTGLITGGVVSLILIYVVNRQSFHWSMDLFVPTGLVTALSLALIASSALIAVFSGRQAMRGDVVRAVKEDW